ncbi:hypothetical protein QYF36_022684 [Acer negundo]|nr:hypothetical protein QYF36_022684 [Acer negundo]
MEKNNVLTTVHLEKVKGGDNEISDKVEGDNEISDKVEGNNENVMEKVDGNTEIVHAEVGDTTVSFVLAKLMVSSVDDEGGGGGRVLSMNDDDVMKSKNFNFGYRFGYGNQWRKELLEV